MRPITETPTLATVAMVVLATACGSDPCESVADEASLESALGSSSCVEAQGGVFTGSFTVRRGSTLRGADGQQVTFKSSDASIPAVRLEGGASLRNVEVIDTAGVGVLIVGTSVVVESVTVRGAAAAALALMCDGDDCAGEVELHDVSATNSSVGLWATGTHVVMQGGDISDNTATSLDGGLGAVVTHGATLELHGTAVERNETVGLLIDASDASLYGARVLSNEGRGVWAQNLAGTVSEPALYIGDDTRIVANAFAGVGVVGSTGAVIEDSRIQDTISVPHILHDGTTGSIGDGVSLLRGSGAIRVSRSELRDNGRVQLIVDSGGSGIEVTESTVDGTDEDALVVVQQTDSGNVTVDNGGLMTTVPIPDFPVDDGDLPVPGCDVCEAD